jgi:threonine aldolase
VRPLLHGFGFVHHSQPRVISITQCTELGTVYTPDEVRALADLAHEHGMLLHMDGARLCNAAASLDLDMAALTRDCGVDVLSFGGTKNGMMYGEAVIFFDPALAHDFVYIRKQGMQLASKMRYVGAQFEALLGGGLWLDNARHANAMAARLAEGVRRVPGVEITRPVQTNAVFARMTRRAIEALQERYFFYVWDENLPEVRWMTSYDTTEGDVDAFVRDLQECAGL